jgi:CheY-like chemotaxis protein
MWSNASLLRRVTSRFAPFNLYPRRGCVTIPPVLPNPFAEYPEALIPLPPVKRILLVEDDPDVRDVLAFLLGKEGYEVRPAPSLGAAMAQRERFDLYVIDRQLPDGDGLELCRAVKRQHFGARVVIYSGSALPEDHKAAYAAGADAYVNKPHLSHLAQTVKDKLR